MSEKTAQQMLDDPLVYAVAELKNVEAVLTDMGLQVLANRLFAVRSIFADLVTEAEQENDRLEREKLEAEERKRQSKEKAAETRLKRQRWDQKCKTHALSLQPEEQEDLLCDWFLPTLATVPRAIPIVRDDEGSIWAELTPNVPSDIVTTREDMGTVMQIAEMHGLVKRDLTKKLYIEDVEAVRAMEAKHGYSTPG